MATESSSPVVPKSTLDVPSTELLNGLQQLVGYVDRHKVASLVLLAFIYPSLGRWSLLADVQSTSMLSSNRCYELVLVFILGLAALHQNSHFSWQLRFAWLQWTSLRSTFEKFLGGSVITLTLVISVISPFPILSAFTVMLVAWQYILVTYHASIRQITAESEQVCYQAKLLVDKARMHAEKISGSENSTLNIINSACNNASTYNVELLARVPDAETILTQNVTAVSSAAMEISNLATTSSQNLCKVLEVFEKITWISAKAKLLVTHGEQAEAVALLASTTAELKVMVELEADLLASEKKAHDAAVKVHSQVIVETYKKLLGQIRIRTTPPAPAPVPPAEPPKAILPNKVTLRNPIALAGALTGAPQEIDDKAFNLTLPFPIKIYGHSSTVLSVNDNGMICLDQPPSDVREKREGQSLPYTDGVPQYALFPLWTDLMIRKGKPHGIYYEFEGEAPNRKVTIEYYVTRYTMQDYYFHFLVILEEARPSVVTFKYYDVEDKGKQGTVGVQGGRKFQMFSYNQTKVVPGLQLVFDCSVDVSSMQASTFQLP